MRTLLIIIPGSGAGIPRFLKKYFHKFYNYFGVDRQGDAWAYVLKDHIEKHTPEIDIHVFKWIKGFYNIIFINLAAKKLAKFLKKRPGYDRVVLLGKSLGGIVAEDSLRYSKELGGIIHLIYVATPHKKSFVDFPQPVKITNIFSNEDMFLNLGRKLLHFGFGRKTIEGADNIVIKNMKHADFNKNIVIPYQGEKRLLFELYTKLILE
ncbi:MAG: hypothetical protein PHH01_01380 [Patescibacteria group bacterium]|nr:hypothetical protein [Patescibacteria group bacterium]